MPYLWIGGDGDCAQYAITRNTKIPCTVYFKGNSPKKITEIEADLVILANRLLDYMIEDYRIKPSPEEAMEQERKDASKFK